MQCTRCANDIGPVDRFCPRCGMPVGEQTWSDPSTRSDTPPGWNRPPVPPDWNSPTAQSVWSQPQAIPYNPYTTNAAPSTTGNGFSVGAIICGILALVFCPILLGPTGIVLGFVGRSRGESRATIGIAVSIAGTVIGMVLGALIAMNMS